MLQFQTAAFLELAGLEAGGTLVVLGRGLGAEMLFRSLVTHFAHPTGLVLALGLNDSDIDKIIRDFTKGVQDADLEALPFRALDASTSPLKRAEIYVRGGVVACTARVLLLDLLQERLVPDLIAGVLIYNFEERCAEFGMDAFILELITKANSNLFIRAITERPEALGMGLYGFERALRSMHISDVHFFPRFNVSVNEDLERAPIDISEIKVGLSREVKAAQVLLLDLLSSCLKQLLLTNHQLDPEEHTLDSCLLPGFEGRIRSCLESTWNMNISTSTLRLLDDIRNIKQLCLNNLSAQDRQSFRDQVEEIFRLHPDDVPYWMNLDSAELLLRSVRSEKGTTTNAKIRVIQDIIQDHSSEAIYVLTNNLEMYDTLLEFVTHDDDSDEITDGKDSKRKKTKVSNSLHVELFDNSDSWIEKLKGVNVLVLSELSLNVIRQIEVYQALASGPPLKVYYLMYVDSVEEQRYLYSVRREKEAFERLIHAYANVPETITKADEDDKEVQDDSARFSKLISEEQEEGHADSRDIIVDVRELRSALPFVLFKRSFRIIPLTLDTGDYIVAEGVAVERKSLSDLWQSLNSGRLLAQSERLLSEFDLAILLIELSGSMQRSVFGDLSTSIHSTDLMGKLSVLLHHRPMLRLVWSSGPQATADHFADLKRRRPPPISSAECRYSAEGRNALLAFRGIVDERNVRLLLDGFKCLRDVLLASEQKLKEVLGDESGGKLFRAINK